MRSIHKKFTSKTGHFRSFFLINSFANCNGLYIFFTGLCYSDLADKDCPYLQFGPDYTLIFSTGWNFAPLTELKYWCDYMLNFSLGAKRKFPWQNLLRCENTIDAHARVFFSARAEKIIAIIWIFQPMETGWKSLPGFRDQARIFTPTRESARAETLSM